MTREGKIPLDCQKIPRENYNKTKLFNFLADKIACVASPNVVIVTKEEDAVSNCTINLDGVALCGHEKLTCGTLCMPDMQQKQAAKSS